MKRSRGLVSVKSGLRSMRSLGGLRQYPFTELQFLNTFYHKVRHLRLCRAKRGTHMIGVEHGRRIQLVQLVLRAAGCLTALTLLNSPLPGIWSSVAWGQQSPTQLN